MLFIREYRLDLFTYGGIVYTSHLLFRARPSAVGVTISESMLSVGGGEVAGTSRFDLTLLGPGGGVDPEGTDADVLAMPPNLTISSSFCNLVSIEVSHFRRTFISSENC